jgi:hypothetical protein
VAIPSGRIRLDVGRLIMVPPVGVILLADLFALDHRSTAGAGGVLGTLSAVLVLTFYALLIWCYLRRTPSIATSGSVTAHAAAVTATWLPFALPLLHGSPPGPVRQVMSDVLIVCGTSWAMWSLRFLGRNVSVLARCYPASSERGASCHVSGEQHPCCTTAKCAISFALYAYVEYLLR